MDSPTPTSLTLTELQAALQEYGWHSQEQETAHPSGPEKVVFSYYTLPSGESVPLLFRIAGEFLLVSTYEFLSAVPEVYAKRCLTLNDTLKSVKLFALPGATDAKLSLELGFELWNVVWQKELLFTHLDLLCLGIESVLKAFSEEGIPHHTTFLPNNPATPPAQV